jgi:glucosamine--fructose-6-phosphate aminotransferase (isomerizing)
VCGIVGYTGKRQAQTILLNSLKKLEYRGYDSCGIALANPEIGIYKDAVRVSELEKLLPQLSGTVGIGHTRWATHGAPCKVNAHPHTDCTGKIAVVHNGVISNFQRLKQGLSREGHQFSSETDSEVIAHLVEKYYQGDLKNAVEASIKVLEGSYAIIVLMEGKPEIVAARKDSPLIMGIGDQEIFIASDVPAILDYTNRVIYLEDGDIGVVTPENIYISQNGKQVSREEQKILWNAEQARKGGYEHFLLKEIHEQPKVIRDTIAGYLSGMELPSFILDSRENLRILFLACGTSYYAATVGKYFCENLLGLPIRIEIASEFNYLYKCPAIDIGIALTQSGETLDTLKAMKRLKEAGSKVIAITNVVGSTASKIADQTLYTLAGPEISVAATKTFTSQLLALYWMVISSSHLDIGIFQEMVKQLRQLPEKVQEVLSNKDQIIESADELAEHENVFYIGRGINYAIASEGALKLKEVSYIHSEAYAAGEIKHGPFALLKKETPVVAIVAQDNTKDAILTNMKEIKARGSPILAIAPEGDTDVEDFADTIIRVPVTEGLFSPFVNAVVVQLLAYYAAKKRGCSIDFPRNLAKSVTVE